ncbi:unnamed protein product [Moneuplotes crassus]|uniref:Uncharacterized protein n=1 Tax=Euplotes crassus TaxID=5936 RepID=A0AAD2D6L2_EUPCR|nr:unnamed protein product [Moneuplotes crassus]
MLKNLRLAKVNNRRVSKIKKAEYSGQFCLRLKKPKKKSVTQLQGLISVIKKKGLKRIDEIEPPKAMKNRVMSQTKYDIAENYRYSNFSVLSSRNNEQIRNIKSFHELDQEDYMRRKSSLFHQFEVYKSIDADDSSPSILSKYLSVDNFEDEQNKTCLPKLANHDGEDFFTFTPKNKT